MRTVYVAGWAPTNGSGRFPHDPVSTVAEAVALVRPYGEIIVVGSSTPVTETSPWVGLQAGVQIRGHGRRASIINKAFNGDLLSVPSHAGIHSLTIDLQGDTFTGRGLSFLDGTYQQSLNNIAIIKGDQECLWFGKHGGAEFSGDKVMAYRVNAGTTTDRFAVVFETAGVVDYAVPRRFWGLDTAGTCSIHFGSSNNTAVVASMLGDTGWGPDSRLVSIVATRLVNDLYLTVDGHENSIVGSAITPSVTLAPGADNLHIGPGALNSFPVIDNTGNGRNTVSQMVSSSWSPTIVNGTVGDGLLRGWFSRQGSVVTITAQLDVGSTTVIPAGEIRFSLPYQRGSTWVEICGQGMVSSASSHAVFAQVVGAVSYVRLLAVSSGAPVTGVLPASLATGDIVRFTASYHQ